MEKESSPALAANLAEDRDVSPCWAGLFQRWETFASQCSRLSASVSADQLIAELLAEVRVQLQVDRESPLKLVDAARYSGYSADHLGKLLRKGKLENLGRKGAPRIAKSALPLKPGANVGLPQVSRDEAARAVLAKYSKGRTDGP